MHNDAVITGLGVLTSGGFGVEAFAEDLKKGRCGITRCDQDGLEVAGRLRSFDFEKNLARLSLSEAVKTRALRAGRRAPRSAQCSILTSLEAWGQAFGDGPSCPPARVNLLIAGNNVNQGYQHGVMTKFRDDPEYVPASYALHFMDTGQIGLLSEILGVGGEGFTVGGASASGNLAILQAYRQIRHGLCDACVVVGAMADLSPVELRAFRHAGALGGKRFASQPEKACRPFDADREGFIYGQGSACLILESSEQARQRGVSVWGRIAGGSACLDGNRSSDPSAAGEARAMIQAVADAGRAPEEIDYVNGHATSSVLGDEVELEAMKAVFGSRIGEVWLNATKGLIGHGLSAAGVIEAAATFIQMKGGFLHPNLNLENPIDDECRFVPSTAVPVQSALALSNAFGFGGINTSIVLENASNL